MLVFNSPETIGSSEWIVVIAAAMRRAGIVLQTRERVGDGQR